VLIDVVDVRLVLVGGSSLLHNIDPKDKRRAPSGVGRGTVGN
jgi:hypothetical protein